jgi:hypothetical protein
MSNQLELLKEAGQDFEWYPTTEAMLEVVAKDIREEFEASYHEKQRAFSILDIGAGNGSALKIICDLTNNTGDKYAIEKSRILVDSLPEDVFVIGTDFHQQTLIDKQVDVVFCNPPYSEFDEWVRRITAEANCRIVYLVIPRRWKENKSVVEMINRRCGLTRGKSPFAGDDEENEPRYRRHRGSCEVLASMDFEDSEFRKARAVVDIVKIKFQDQGYRNHELDVDPWDIWFDSVFSIQADKTNPSKYEAEQHTTESLHNLVKGQNVIERLEELYRADFDKLLETYRALEKLDASLFKELGVSLSQVKGGLKSKIAGLKNLYWKELFSNLDAITKRLTSKSREKLLATLTAHTAIDFTADNAYAVVVWAIKNANHYFDEQLKEVYYSVTHKDCIKNYKSNKRVVTDDWRYSRSELSHYTLDYRLVLHRYRCFDDSGYGKWEYPNGLHNDIHALLNDLCTIAKNLGFDVVTTSFDMEWERGKLREFFLADGTLFMDVRAFYNGNIHIRCNQDFMRRFNIEAARLNGWVKSPAEAKEETGIEDAAELYGSNFKLKSIKLLAEGKTA